MKIGRVPQSRVFSLRKAGKRSGTNSAEVGWGGDKGEASMRTVLEVPAFPREKFWHLRVPLDFLRPDVASKVAASEPGTTRHRLQPHPL